MNFFKNRFFRNKKIFITGHTGFKGSWLTQILLELEARVCGYALEPNTNPSLFNILGLEKSIDHKIGDIRDFQFLNKTVKDFAPEIVFHLAAQPLVRDSYDDPRYTHEVNIMGTVNILEAIRLNNIRVGVIITTDKVYRNIGQNRSFREDDPLGGHDPYSCSKASADLVVNSYIQSFFNPKNYKVKHNTLIASVRAGNVIGGGDWAKDRLVPDLIRAFLIDRKEVIIRNPKAIRPWQHVLDPLSGYMLLAKFLFEGDTTKSGAWNFGSEEDEVREVEAIVSLFIKIFGKGNYVARKDKTKHEDKVLRLNIEKAQKELNWKSKFTVEEAIKETVSWYKVFYTNRSDICRYTARQIRNYFER